MFDQASTLRKIMDQEFSSYKTAQGQSHALHHGQRNLSIPKVIAISGGKGGVGKSLLTANIGQSLASLGRKVLLIDGDLGLSNLDVVMNLKTRGSLDDVLAGHCRLEDIIVAAAPDLEVIPASSGFLKVPDLERIHKLILLDQVESLNTQYDFVLIDTPAGVSRTVQHWAASAADVVIVVTPEPTSLADGYATMKILKETTHETRFNLVVNMASSSEEALQVFERFSSVAEEYLGVYVGFLGAVPLDNNVRLSVRHRSLLVRNFPFSKAAISIGNIAAKMSAKTDTTSAKGTVQFFWKRMVNYGNGEMIF